MSSNNLLKQWWQQLLFDLPRVIRHPTSRKRVGLILLVSALLAVLCLVVYGPFALFEYKFGGGIGGLAFMAVMYALAFSFRRGMKNKGNAITLSLSTTPAPSLRQAIFRQRLILATLINRAAFEAAELSGNSLNLPPGTARAAQLDRLRAEGVWESLPAPLRERLASPESTWTKEHTARILLHADAVAVLTWMLDPEADLPSLRNASMQEREAIRPALINPDPVAELNFLRKQTELESQGNPAVVYILRITNELIKRGVVEGQIEPALEEHLGAYTAYATSIGEADIITEDLPIGGVLIGEAATDDLSHLRGVAAVRIVTLQALKEALLGNGVAALQQILLGLA